MSLDFMQTISEIPSQRYLVQLQNLVARKIPCGFFTGFSEWNNTNLSIMINDLKNMGLNLTCVCVIDANQVGGGGGKSRYSARNA